MNTITGGFSRLYRGSWPQGEMGWTVDLLIIQNLVSGSTESRADHGLEFWGFSLSLWKKWWARGDSNS